MHDTHQSMGSLYHQLNGLRAGAEEGRKGKGRRHDVGQRSIITLQLFDKYSNLDSSRQYTLTLDQIHAKKEKKIGARAGCNTQVEWRGKRPKEQREREEKTGRGVREGRGRGGETEVKASGQVSYGGRGEDERRTKRSVIYPSFPVARGKCESHCGRVEEGGDKGHLQVGLNCNKIL